MGNAWVVHWAAEGVSRSGGYGRLHRLGLQIVGPRAPGACSLMGGRGEHTCETLCERPSGMSFICAVIGLHVG